MTDQAPSPDWQTPEEFAAEIRRPVRWVKDQMAAGLLPSIKLGGRRYWTPECREALMARQLADAAPAPPQRKDDPWGRARRAG